MNTEHDPRRCCSGQERRKIDTQGMFPELLWTNMQATRESGSSSLIENLVQGCTIVALSLLLAVAQLGEKINPLFQRVCHATIGGNL
jgi:hypothetical protein